MLHDSFFWMAHNWRFCGVYAMIFSQVMITSHVNVWAKECKSQLKVTAMQKWNLISTIKPMTPKFYCILCRWSSFEVSISRSYPFFRMLLKTYNGYNTILKLRFDILSINPFPFLHFYFHLSTSLSSSFLHFLIVFASFSSFQTSFFLFWVKSSSHLDHHFQ